ncbi:MAG: thiamine biosynthesis protein ThiI [Methanomassiliicoccales archaeon PtaU1.Bin124]|nr:MAG: thiamine biosynthesis protein ThiI [Methanomassiliicoccales archaeon PtaU1.Bin124]
MDLILVRYAEVGLKSRGVRKRFERILMDNMLSILAHDGVEALVRNDQGRIFVQSADIDKAVRSVQKVFGVASVSPVVKCGSNMEEMRARVAELSRNWLEEGSTFKIEARRSGSHSYNSMQAAASIGEAVLWANEDRGIKVNIHHPDKVIYVEIRENMAYVFSDYVPGPGGLPMGSQGKVLAMVRNDRDALAAWLIMKRGCRCVAVGEDGPSTDLLRSWDPDMKLVSPGDMVSLSYRHRAAAVVFGSSIADEDELLQTEIPVPVFYPIVGWSEDEVAKGIREIKAGRPAHIGLV